MISPISPRKRYLQKKKKRKDISKRGGLTDAGRDVGSALLVAPRAAVARYPRDSVLAGTLAGALITRLPRGADGVAVAG